MDHLQACYLISKYLGIFNLLNVAFLKYILSLFIARLLCNRRPELISPNYSLNIVSLSVPLFYYPMPLVTTIHSTINLYDVNSFLHMSENMYLS